MATGENLRECLLAGLSVTERQLDIDGFKTNLLKAGSGPQLFLVHGGIECGGIYWAPVIARLSESHSLVIPDVPGLGESEPMKRLTSDTFSSWFGHLLAETSADGEVPSVVAHSMTGSLVARFASRNNEMMKSLVLYGAPGIGPHRMPAGLVFAAVRFGLKPSMASHERFLPWPFLDPRMLRQRDPEWFGAFSEYMVSRGSVSHVKKTMRQLVGAGKKEISSDDLSRIEVPTSLIWGESDRMTPLSLGRGASERFGWPLSVVRASGHVPHVEQPDAFARLLPDQPL